MAEVWKTKQIDKFILVNHKLGQGQFGVVYRGFFKEDETKQVAVKTIPIKVKKQDLFFKAIKDSAKMIELIKREISILQQVKHPNIVTLFEVTRTSNSLYLFLEYCSDGDMKNYLQSKKDKRLSEVQSSYLFIQQNKVEAVTFLKQLVEGFKQLHQMKIIHRDIKPANILLHNGKAKITDFGFARVLDTEMNDPSYFSRVGSPLYMAPQILEGQPFSSKCDVWSMGIMLYEFLYGKTPWDAENQYGLLQNIKKNGLTFPDIPIRSEKIKELISCMLKLTEKERFSWEQIFNHDIIKIDQEKIKSNMESLLQGSEELLQPALMNKLYIEDNLVVGYINNDTACKEEQSTNTLGVYNQALEDRMSQLDIDQEKGEQILQSYNTDKNRRKIMLQYNNYFLFERNIAFFFNYVIQKIIKLMHMGALKLSKGSYYEQIFCISKNQNIHLHRLQDQLNEKNPPKFDKDVWGRYLTSVEYKKVYQLTQNDIKHTKDFYQEILKKSKDVILKQFKPNDPKIKKFEESFDFNFTTNQSFLNLYHEIIQDSIVKIKAQYNEMKEQSSKDPNNKVNEFLKQLLQLQWFYIICLNPYLHFKDIHMDFNQFYEDNQNINEIELMEKINKKMS